MIIYKQWNIKDKHRDTLYKCEGWFLFGFVPIYIRRVGVK